KDIDGNPEPRFIAFGQVIGIHIDESFIKDGLLDTGAMKPIARAGYQEYFVTTADARFFLKFTEAHKMRAQSHAKKTEEYWISAGQVTYWPFSTTTGGCT